MVCTDTKKGLQVEPKKGFGFLIISVLINLLWQACANFKRKKTYKD